MLLLLAGGRTCAVINVVVSTFRFHVVYWIVADDVKAFVDVNVIVAVVLVGIRILMPLVSTTMVFMMIMMLLLIFQQLMQRRGDSANASTTIAIMIESGMAHEAS